MPVPTPEHIKSAVRAWHAVWLPLRDADPHATGQLLPDGHSALERIEHVLRVLVAAYAEAAYGRRIPELPDRAFNEARCHRSLACGVLTEMYEGLDRLIQRNRDGKDRNKICEPLLHDLVTERDREFNEDPVAEVFECITHGFRAAMLAQKQAEKKKRRRNIELPGAGVDAGFGPMARGGGVRAERSKLFVALAHLEYFDMAVASGALSVDRQLDLGLVLLRESAKYPDAIARFRAAGAQNAYPHLMALTMRGLAESKSLGDWIEWFRNQNPLHEFEERLQAIVQVGKRAEAAGRDLFPGKWLFDTLRERGFEPCWSDIGGLDKAVSRARENLVNAFERGADGELVLREQPRLEGGQR